MPALLRCPKCNNMCEFDDGIMFGYCNKCGSKLERDVKNTVSVYDKNAEEDEEVAFAWERFDECTKMTVPTRDNFDIESMNYEIERMMDEFMTFGEVLKDIYSSLDSMEADRKLRVCALCYDMSNRIFLQFENFLREYNDFGMYDELKAVRDAYSSTLQKLSSDFTSRQKAISDGYWASRPEEFKALTEALRKAEEERARVTFFDFNRKWELDAEIERLQAELSRTG